MAITHQRRAAGDGERDGAAEAAAGMAVRVHGAPTHGQAPFHYSRSTSPFSEYRIATTSFFSAWSYSFLVIAARMSSIAATSSCSLTFMPLCADTRSLPV